MTPQEIINVVKAFEEGKEIEVTLRSIEKDINSKWAITKKPVWNFNTFTYRVIQKQKEKELYQYLIYNSKLNKYQTTFGLYQNIYDLQSELTSDWKIIQRLNHTKVTIKEE